MKYKTSMIIMFIAIFLFAVSATCAADIDETSIATEDSSQMELSINDKIQAEDNNLLIQKDNDETVGAGTDNEILATGEGSYSDLRDEIDNGGDKNLTKKYYTYTVSDGNTIVINTPGVINGNGAVIDMSGFQAFIVSVSGVTIKNLTIINAKCNGMGGAIYFRSSGTLINCNFTGNYADSGGAVYFTSTGNVTNCNFVKNSASNLGGAVYFVDSGTVSNCNFADNFAPRGGAIFSVTGYTTADTCIFKRNSGDNVNTFIYPPTLNVNNFTTVYGSGDKLTFDLKTNSSIPVTNGNISISVYFKNGTWFDNYSCLSGEGWIPNLPVGLYHAIFNTEYANFQKINRTLKISDGTTFWDLNQTINADTQSEINLINNYTFNPDYDADFVEGIVINRSVTINGNGSTINAKGKARIFEVLSDNVVLKNIIFKNGNITGDGGAVHFGGSGTVENCNFTNNSADYAGGAIHMYSGSVENCIFINNTARYGGAIRFYNNGTTTNCNFTNNKAIGTYPWGGAICFSNIGNITNCNFADNTATYLGGAVFFYDKGTVTNCNFTDNTANGGGAVYFYRTGTVANCNFVDNTASRDGGAIYIYSGTVTNCNFTNNKATGTGNYDGGGAVYFYSAGSVTNCNFTNNKATGTGNYDGGGAVYFYQGTGSVTNCNFTGNTATRDGGAVYFSNNGNVTNCNFTGNTATGDGGAIYFLDQGNVTNCNFTDNIATSDGGVVYFYEEGTVSNCNFINNTASSHGGAIWISSGRVENCNFTDNRATGDGGAIRFSSSRSTVSNCNFTHNSANRGSAVYFDNSGRIENCNLFNNSATRTGGAIYFRGSNAFVTNCNLVDNRAIGSDWGGAIWMNSGKIVNCNFTNNNAFGNGGAVVLFAGDVENCNFINNQAINGNGGAIWMSTGSVTNSNFVNHNARYNGGAIWMGSGKIDNCNFTGNNATAGSAIFIYSTSDYKNVSNSCFLNNRANAENLDVTINENNIITITFTGNDNLLNAIYSNGDVDFSNVTYWGANRIANTDDSPVVRSKNEAGQNITVVGVVNGNIMNITKVTDSDGKIVLEDIVGDYCIIVRHNTDSYYTEAEKISTNMKLYANVTPQTTNNRTVNITAKSNIPNEVINGKLLFILPNNTSIAANYSGDGIWWAEHIFDEYGEYEVSASYIGLTNVTVNNATIAIDKANSTLTIDDIVFDYGGVGSTAVNYTNASGVNVSVVGQPQAVVDVVNNTITVSGLDVGTYTLSVTTVVDDDHSPVTQTANITVNKAKTVLTADAVTTTYNVNKYLVITLKDKNGIPLKDVSISVDLNGVKTYNTDSNGQVKVPTKGLAPKSYTAKITFKGNTNYEKSTKEVKVTVKKVASKISAAKKTFKSETKVKKYAAVLKDNTGKAIKNAKLALKVKGKTYSAKTNSKGKAVFKITKLNKKGSFKAVIKFNGNKYYAKSTKNVKIAVKSTFKTVSKGSKDKKTVKKIQQALKDHGYYITYKGHYLKVDGKYESCTARSVKEFQRDHGLKVTGKVDYKTAKKLKIV